MAPDAPEPRLDALLAREHQNPASPAVRTLVDAIRDRHPGAVVGILFYGSCLRRNVDEGVHDFYVLVDSYRGAYTKARLRILNQWLPPNVFYVESEDEAGVQRAKYAVISVDDFERMTRPGCLHPYIWARFAQPSLLVYSRDADSRQRILGTLAQAIKTLVQRLGVFLPARGSTQRYSMAALWQEAFRRTYATELRGEHPETIARLYEADAVRYDAMATAALLELATDGFLENVDVRGNAVETRMTSRALLGGRARWRVLHPLAKTIAFVRLLKSATTFGDWLPYILWKVERHSGEPLIVSERQRRHPFIFGWPVFLELLRRGVLR